MHSGSQNALVPMIDKNNNNRRQNESTGGARVIPRGPQFRHGWSIATRSGGLAYECVLFAVPPAYQIAVVFAAYQDSETAVSCICMNLIINQIYS